MAEKFDIIIIGSGAGGSPIANILAKKGRKVLVLEKGPLLRSQEQNKNSLSEYKRDEMQGYGSEKRIMHNVTNKGDSFFSSFIEPDINDEPHIYVGKDGKDYATIEGYTAQVAGGGTVHYGGVSLRFTPIDFQLATFNEGRNDLKNDPNGTIKTEARNWAITYDDLEPYYCKAEQQIGISGTSASQAKPFSNDYYHPPLPPNPISHFVEEGMTKLNIPHYRTPIAIITKDHEPSKRKAGDPKTGYVNRYGDPLELKSDTWVSLLSPIRDLPNFVFRPNCIVTHLECNNERITTVNYRDPAGRPVSVEGDIVVVACSAIESVRLLKISAEMNDEFNRRINQNDLLGKYFLTHSFGGCVATVPGRYDKSLSVDSDWATDYCAMEEFIKDNGLWAGGAIYNNTSDEALPISLGRTFGAQDLDTLWKGFENSYTLAGQRFVDFFDSRFGRRLSMAFMANQVPQKTNRIELHSDVYDKWGRKCAYIIKDWHSHDIYLMDTLANMCAKIIEYGVDGGQGNFKVVEKGGVYLAENSRARIANHILGGARFGNDPADSVLDKNCKAWKFDNLYVTDGSFMPSSGSGNPTLTIQANSFRIADILQERL